MPVICTPVWIDDGTNVYPEAGSRIVTGVSGAIFGNATTSGSIVMYDQSGGSVKFNTVSSLGTSYNLTIPSAGTPAINAPYLQIGSASVGYVPMWVSQSVLSASPFSYGVVEPLCSYIGTPGSYGKVGMYNGVLDSNADDLFQGAGMSFVGHDNANPGSCGAGGAEIWITDNTFLLISMDEYHQNELQMASFSKNGLVGIGNGGQDTQIGDWRGVGNATIFGVSDNAQEVYFAANNSIVFILNDGGAVTRGAWQATTIGTPYGGTGQNTYTNGQLLIGNSTGNTLSRGTLSAGPGITIQNGNGTIAISASVVSAVTQVVGTANQITIVNGTTTPTASIASTYQGQTSINTLGTVLTGVWSGSIISMAEGGTSANLTPANGSVFYSTATATALLAANSTGVNKYLQSVSSGVPSWAQIASTDIINTSFVTQVVGTANQITISGAFIPTASIAVTYPGQTSITTLGTVVTGVWSGSIISLAEGGTSAALTPNNGGIHYSTATATAILAGTATANQVLLSGATAAPAWSTAAYPATTTINQILYSSAANTIGGISTANNSVLTTNGSGVPSFVSVLPPSIGGTGTTTVFSNGSVVVASGSSGTYIQDNANFYYDYVNHRLGLGTTAPSASLSVIGAFNTSFTPALWTQNVIFDNAASSSQNITEFRVAHARQASFRIDASGDLVLNGAGAGSIYLNHDEGTGGTNFSNGHAVVQTTIGSSGIITKYNTISTVANGVPSILAQVNTTGQTANINAATLYAVPASGAGLYEISSLIVETTAGSVSSTLPNVQIVYTDQDTGGTITIDATPILGIAGIGQTGALTANTVGTTSTGVIVVNAKASSNIQYQTVNYASSLAGMAYTLRIRLKALG